MKVGSSLAVNPQTSQNVGPGAYNLGHSKTSKNVRGDTGFGTDMAGRSIRVGAFAPGPGMYNTSGTMDKENGHIFGTSTRADAKDLMKNPGPGAYNMRSSISQGKGASMKAKTAYGGFL